MSNVEFCFVLRVCREAWQAEQAARRAADAGLIFDALERLDCTFEKLLAGPMAVDQVPAAGGQDFILTTGGHCNANGRDR